MNAAHGNDNSNQLTVALPVRDENDSYTTWMPHPAFKGVRLKHLITGADTNGKLSVHLVRVEPLCALTEHQHEKQLELHEVLQGKGTCQLGGQLADYVPGAMAVIPLGNLHEVIASKQGLLLKAIFTPALL